jgi:coproporphyrinogen III oxidase-like Fe-S oxidoreductase
MSRAIAVTATQENPFKAAIKSAENFSRLVIDFMYGTPRRTQLTFAFTFTLVSLGCFLNLTGSLLLQTCPI